MPYEDKTLTCQECGTSFTFTGGEQEFFNAKGFTNEPRRCPACRQVRRNQNNGGSYGRAQREMHLINCAQCGKEDHVPFRPRGDRPVYCSDCFSSAESRSSQ